MSDGGDGRYPEEDLSADMQWFGCAICVVIGICMIYLIFTYIVPSVGRWISVILRGPLP